MKNIKDEVRAGLPHQGPKSGNKNQNKNATPHPVPLPERGGEGVKRVAWWEALAPGERKLICDLMRMLRGAKQSELRDVAIAAAKWERGIGCFIKVRLMNDRNPRVVISCRSVSRSRPGVSPNRG